MYVTKHEKSILLHDDYKKANTFGKKWLPKCHNIIYYIWTTKNVSQVDLLNSSVARRCT